MMGIWVRGFRTPERSRVCGDCEACVWGVGKLPVCLNRWEQGRGNRLGSPGIFFARSGFSFRTGYHPEDYFRMR